MGREAMPDRVAILLSTYLFRDLSPAEVEPLARAAREVRLQRGQAAFRIGDPADALMVVASGRVKECLVDDSGEEVVFEVFTPGAIEGEPGLFSVERDRVIDLVAMVDTTLLRIDREVLLAFLRDHPPVTMRLLEGLATMARQAVEDQTALARRRVRDRVGLKLLELSMTHGRTEPNATRITIPLSQGTLASMAGASRENVNRALGALAAEGLVRIDERGYVVDAIRLAATIGGEPPRHRRNRSGEPAM